MSDKDRYHRPWTVDNGHKPSTGSQTFPILITEAVVVLVTVELLPMRVHQPGFGQTHRHSLGYNFSQAVLMNNIR